MSKREMTVREMATLGGKATQSKYKGKVQQKWAGMGGIARREKYTAAELQEFARNAGRKPYKVTPNLERRIQAMLRAGKTQKQIAAQMGLSLRTIGRLAKRLGLRRR